MKKSFLIGAFIACVLATFTFASQAARLIIASDDWVFTNTGFANSVGTTTLATNFAEFLTGSTSGSIHAYSSDGSLSQSSLVNTLSNAGYTYTTGTGISFDLATLQNYDAVFLGIPFLTTTELAILSDYANSGSGVYIHAGRGLNDPAAAGTTWNPFLEQYGLAFGLTFSGLNGTYEVQSTSPLFAGVTSVYVAEPHTITGCCVVATTTTGVPLFAASPVPIPPALWLFGSGLLGLVGIARRKKA